MNDQDWINLQKLTGRGPQPWSLPPDEPDHILAARAMQRQFPELASMPQVTPEQQMYAGALGASIQAGRQASGADISPQPLAARYAGDQRPAPGGSQPAPDSGARYAMGSPANLDLPWETMADANTPPQPAPKPAPGPAPAPAPAASSVQTTIDPIPGYDETGHNAWRKANDQIFLDAVNRHNATNGYRPGDPGYWTADLLKAQAMRESGGNRRAFLTDPLQVNNSGDWSDEKKTITGLKRGEVMTPESSAEAALKWIKHKAWHNHDYLGDVTAIQNYNGRTDPVAGLPNVPFSELYARDIMTMAGEAARIRNQKR